MATQIASLFAKITADTSEYKRAMQGVKDDTTAFQRGFSNVQSSVMTGLKALGVTAGVTLGAMGAAVGITGTKFNALKEQAMVAFTTMLGSGERAEAMLNDLQKFAATTPFEFPDLLTASQRLLAMGFAAQDVKPLLTAVGDAVAALGGTSEMVDRVTLALGQMQAKGKVSAEEMLQLTEAGIPAWEILANKIGVSIPDAMKMATNGAITADTAIAALVEGMNTRFGGMMAQQSRTFNGLVSTVKDTFAQLSGTVMAPFFAMMQKGLAAIVDFISRPEFTAGVERFAARITTITDKFMAWAEDVLPQVWEWLTRVWDIMAAAGTAFANMVRPLVDAIGKFVKWQDVLMALGGTIAVVLIGAIGSLIASFAPLLAALAVVTATIAALRMAWQNDFAGIRTTTQKILEQLSNWFFKESGIWRGTWEDTLKYLKWWGQYGWRDAFYNPIVVWLRDTRWEITAWYNRTVQTFKDWAGNVRREVETWASGAVGKFNHWRSEVERVVDLWTGVILTKFRVWKNEAMSVVNAWTSDFRERIDNVLERLNLNTWLGKGRDMMQGLWDGVRNKWNEFSDWFRNAWESLERRFKNFFGIHSPSKMFERFGLNIGEGFNLGVQRSMQSAPQMLVAGAMAGGVGSTTTYNNTTQNTFNVNMPASGAASQGGELTATVQYLQALYA